MKIENLKILCWLKSIPFIYPLSMYVDIQKYSLKQILCSFVIGILEFAKKKGEKNLFVCLSVYL